MVTERKEQASAHSRYDYIIPTSFGGGSEHEEIKNRLARMSADFDNFRKRVQKERSEWVFEAQKEILLDILAIGDDFERAMEAHHEHGDKEVNDDRAGLALIYASFGKLLQKYDIQPMTEAHLFDPALHDAVMQVESEKESGSIVQIFEKGFTRHNKALRPAKVSVAK